jgi:hypothetical protein
LRVAGRRSEQQETGVMSARFHFEGVQMLPGNVVVLGIFFIAANLCAAESPPAATRIRSCSLP